MRRRRAIRHPGRGLAVTLTGTDLYRDIQFDAAAQHSLQRAQILITLQEKAPDALPAEVRGKARVIYQSTSSRQPLEKSGRHFRAVMVGHLREEKSPETLFAVARLLTNQRDIKIDHIGAGLERRKRPCWRRRITAGWAACRMKPCGAEFSARMC